MNEGRRAHEDWDIGRDRDRDHEISWAGNKLECTMRNEEASFDHDYDALDVMMSKESGEN